VHEFVAAKRTTSKSSASHFTASMQTEASRLVNAPSVLFCKTRLHDADVAGKFPFRQGLWIEDLRTPPGQECSNGSLILLAVVLWRAFSAVPGAPAIAPYQ
jgi:hypothetical protein